MHEIITDAELHQADGWIDQVLERSRRANEPNLTAWHAHKAILELKLRREEIRNAPAPRA